MNRIDQPRAPDGAEARFEGRAPNRELPPASRILTRNQLTYYGRLAQTRAGQSWALPIILLVVAGVCYNCVLAFANARGVPVNRPLVVLTEITILGGVAVTLLGGRAQRIDPAPALFLAFFLVNGLAVSLLSGAIFVEMTRNAAIIALFVMLGARTSPSALTKCFVITAAIAFAVLLVEIVAVGTYAELFNPASYLANTRGIPPSQFDDIGLFGNALGWDERFSILKIIDHRASSIFLEQVSLANFAVVATIFLCCRWQSLQLPLKLSMMAVIALMVITTASRLAFAMTLVAPAVYWLAPKLHRFASAAVMPTVLLTAIIVTQLQPPTKEDNLVGRLGYTIRNLGDLDLVSIAGFNAPQASNFADGGYVYVIVASSIIGLIILWLFVGLIAAGRSDNLKRCSLFLNLYVFSNLSVSGTSTFSIKTAALIWLLVGFMRESEKPNATPAVEPDRGKGRHRSADDRRFSAVGPPETHNQRELVRR